MANDLNSGLSAVFLWSYSVFPITYRQYFKLGQERFLLHAFKLTGHYVPVTGNYTELLTASLNKLQTRIVLPVTVNAGVQSQTIANIIGGG